jgi:hypothetical protein
MPKDTKPKDWRTVEKKGPSAAVSSQPEKLENAWGTETNAKVSQKSLIEAGVVAKPAKKKVPLDERIARWVKRGLLVAAAVGIGVWLYIASRPSAEEASFAKIDADYKKWDLNAKWPAVLRAEYYRILGELRLQKESGVDKAIVSYAYCRDAARQAADAKQKLDRDFFLIELAKTQIDLGGPEAEVIRKNRIGWELDVPSELKQTIGQIENHEARLLALRVLQQPLAERKQEAILKFLAMNLKIDVKHELDAQIADADKAAKGKLDDVLKAVKDSKDDPGKRFDRIVGVATFLHEEMPEKAEEYKKAVDAAVEIVVKHPEWRDRLPQWPLLQLVRLTARTGDAETTTILLGSFREKAKEKPYERRAKFEIQLAKLEKAPKLTDAADIIAEVEPDGQGLAWLAWARAVGRTSGTVQPPEEDERHFDFLIKTALPLFRPETPPK